MGDLPHWEDLEASLEFHTVNGGGTTIYRLREGIERFLISDINNPAVGAMGQSAIPVMWDRQDNDAKHWAHIPGGSNVLYLDGHVTFIKYPEQFPCDNISILLGRAAD